MLILSRKKLNFFIFIFLVTSVLNAKVIDVTNYAEKKHFASGVLKDLTPIEISTNEIQVNENGPLVFVVCVDRGKYMTDTRPASEREQIKFTLEKGSGRFSVMQAPDKKVKNEAVVSPDPRGVATVLFYPSGDGDYLLKVTPTNNPGVTGELDYSFHVDKPKEREFATIGTKNLEQENWRNHYPHHEVIKTSDVSYGEDGKKIKHREVKSTYFSKNEKGEMELRENDENGKLFGSSKKTIEIDPKFTPFNRGKLWGQTKDVVVYVVEDRSPELMLTFYFFNKNDATRTATVNFSPYFITVRNNQYEAFNDYERVTIETSKARDIFGLAISSEEKVHNY